MGVDDPIDRIEAALDDPASRTAVTSSSAQALFGPRLMQRITPRETR
jgi:hypothetical protein